MQPQLASVSRRASPGGRQQEEAPAGAAAAQTAATGPGVVNRQRPRKRVPASRAVARCTCGQTKIPQTGTPPTHAAAGIMRNISRSLVHLNININADNIPGISPKPHLGVQPVLGHVQLQCFLVHTRHQLLQVGQALRGGKLTCTAPAT